MEESKKEKEKTVRLEPTVIKPRTEREKKKERYLSSPKGKRVRREAQQEVDKYFEEIRKAQ